MAQEIGGKRERRPRGLGGVWKPKRKPFYQICLTYEDKYIERSSRCTRRADAVNLLERCNAAIRAGTFTSVEAIRDGVPDAAIMTVAAVADMWLERSVKVVRDEKGFALAKSRVATYLTPMLGDTEALKLTTDDLMDYRQRLQVQKCHRRDKDGNLKETSRKLTIQTVRHILSDARAMVLWAEQRGLVPRGIVPKRKFLPKAPEKPLRSLTPDQQASVRPVEDPYGFAIRLMLDSGVRWSELCRLTRDDLVDGELVIHGMTKSRKMRSVPIPPALVTEIKGHVGKLVPYVQDDDSWFNRAVRLRSGVRAFSAHACRHSFGFNYMARGGNIVVLQELMGHSTITLTAHYAKPSQELVRADAAKVIGWSKEA